MVKISLDDNNLSKMQQFSKIGIDRSCEKISAYLTDESIKIVMYYELPILRTNTGQANNEIIAGGFRNEIN
ncbi:hypothetical protein [Candidatus Nitrosocosmicus sp. T]